MGNMPVRGVDDSVVLTDNRLIRPCDSIEVRRLSRRVFDALTCRQTNCDSRSPNDSPHGVEGLLAALS